MEQNFIEFLNSFGHPFGTWLAIIIGGVTLITGIIIGIKKVKKYYDEKIQKKLIKEQQNIEFHKSIQSVSSNVASIQTNLDSLSNQHKQQMNDLNSKLDDVWDAVIEGQKDSKEGDIALENQLKTNEAAIDTLTMKVSSMDDKTTLLLESDKEGIKAYIVDKYEEAQKKKYIEFHSLQTLEVRYSKYLEENGNTYVGRMMEKMRNMPNDLPSDKDDKK